MSTTSSVSTFTFNSSDVRTVLDESGEPWFVAQDVCDFFGATNRNRVMQRVDAEDKGGTQIDTPGGRQTVTVINESGLYTLLFHLTPTKARGLSIEERERKTALVRSFRRWVTHEVLPSIRRRGMYATPATVEAMLDDPDVMIRLLTEIKAERAERERLAAQVEADRPKVVFADAVSASEDVILVSDLAKLLRQNGIQVGAIRLFAWLRGNGWLIARRGTDWNMPTQRAMELGLFEVSELAITHSDGRVSIRRTTKVTGKGQRFFVERFVDGRFTLAA